MNKNIHGLKYLECSAMLDDCWKSGHKAVFEEAIRAAMGSSKAKKKCSKEKVQKFKKEKSKKKDCKIL